MPNPKPDNRLRLNLLEGGLALLAAAAVYGLWPLTELPCLGREDMWFGLAWLVLLMLPLGLQWLIRSQPQGDIPQTLQAEACGYASYLLAGLFIAFLITGGALGNY
ncbi:MAG: hypothetical protein PVG60_10715, partial [Desulfarculaceae bacterium]